MCAVCSFVISLKSANAIGALRPDFAAGCVGVANRHLLCWIDDADCRVECSREIAFALAAALISYASAHRQSGADVAGSCVRAADGIFSAIARHDGIVAIEEIDEPL